MFINKNTRMLGAVQSLTFNFMHMFLNNRSINIQANGTEIGNNDTIPRFTFTADTTSIIEL